MGAFDAGIGAVRAQLAGLGVPSEVAAILQRIAEAVEGIVLAGLADVVDAAADIVTIAILGGFLTFFLLMDEDKAWDWVLAATDGWRRRALTGGQRAVDQVGGYIRGTAVLAAATALLAAVLMWLLGVPLAGPLAVVALLGAFVPYIGQALAMLLIATIALASVGVVPALLFVALFIVGSIFLERRLARFIAGRRLDLHPILAVVGLPLGYAAGGFAASSSSCRCSPSLRRPPASSSGPRPRTHRRACRARYLSDIRSGPGLARSPGSVELAIAHRRRALHRGGPGRVAVPGGHRLVVVAVILAATLEPAAAALLERRGLGRTTAATIVTVGTGVAIIAVLILTLASLVGPMAQLVSTATAGAGTPPPSGRDRVVRLSHRQRFAVDWGP